MNRRCFALATAAALATSALVGCASGPHLDIEQAELQARIAPRFPTHHCRFVIECLDLSNPVVVLTQGEDRIGLKFDAQVKPGTDLRTGRIAYSGRLRYVPAEGQLFLDDPQITMVDFNGLPARYAEIARQRGIEVVEYHLRTHPIYILDPNGPKGALAKRAARSVKVVDGKLRISFSR